MSRLEELIAELCPDGVEYKELKDILTIKNGRDYKEFGAGDIPVYGSGGIITYIDTYAYDKPSVLIPRKGSIDKLYYVDIPFWTVDTIFYTVIKSDIVIAKFVYYFLETQSIERLNTGGGVPSLTQAVLNKVKIPVPPLPVQEEILRILDKFTELTAELTAELAKRKQQYQYYRNTLVDFKEGLDKPFQINKLITELCPNGVKYQPLKNVCEVRSGWGFPNSEQGLTEGELPFYKVSDMNKLCNGTVMTLANNYISKATAKKLGCSPAPAGTIIFPKIGAAIGTNKKRVLSTISCYDNNVVGLIPNNLIRSKFLFYIMDSINLMQFADYSGAMPSIRKTTLEKYKIPVPPLPIQEEIVRILDRFDALCNDLASGLPAEIEARKKQYEYYRDKLLTFKEAV